MSADESVWSARLKRLGEMATSVQAIIGLIVVLAGGALWLIAQIDGDDDDEQDVKPAASIRVEGRSEQNRTLADQLARDDNRTELIKPGGDASLFRELEGDVHDVEVTFRGHEAPCQIAWTLHNADTNEELPPPEVVKPMETCRTEQSSFHQDVWVLNPDARDAESYFVRFFLLDGDGQELERDDTPRYHLAI